MAAVISTSDEPKQETPDRPRIQLLDPAYEWVYTNGQWRAKRKKLQPQNGRRLIRFPRGWLFSNPGP